MSSICAVFKFFLYFLLILIFAPLHFAMLVFQNFILRSDRYLSTIPIIFHTLTCKVFGLKINIVGAPVKNHQTLFMCNHISYLDIAVLGSIIRAPYLAKKEVASWPLFNILAYLQQSAFIERKVTAIKRETNALDQKLAEGRNFIIFPEGTSSDGRGVWPFKSSLFSIAIGAGKTHLLIQPVSLHLLQVDGEVPEAQNVREIYAWHLHMDMPLNLHFWRFAKSSGACLQIVFHEPLASSDFSDRKDLAKACYAQVAKGLTPLGSKIL